MSADAGRDRPSANSYWVTRDRFAAGEYPGALKSNEAATKIEHLLRAGVDHFIDLTEERELEPYAGILEEVARRLGLNVGHERHPIVDGRVPTSPEQMVRILDAIDSALSEGKTVYVHCWGGVGGPEPRSVAGSSGTAIRGNRPSIRLASGGREWRRPGAYPIHPKRPTKLSTSEPGLSHPRTARPGNSRPPSSLNSFGLGGMWALRTQNDGGN